jgi:nitrous oxide reductase
MARKNDHAAVSRRQFLTNIAMTGAASAVSATGTRQTATDHAAAPGTLQGRPGSDFMVDVLKALEIVWGA